MSIFFIKIIAYISMFLDHIKYAIPQTENFLTVYLGRIAFPLFAFMITEGYLHTKDLKKYYKRLIIFAFISQIPYMLFRSIYSDELFKLNIFFTLILGLLTITIYDKCKNKLISIIGCICICIIGTFLNVDYRWYGICLIFVLYLFKKNDVMLISSFMTVNTVYMMSLLDWEFQYFTNLHCLLLFAGMSIPLIFILMYNGKLGKKTNHIFYLIYPIHLLIFYGLNFIF